MTRMVAGHGPDYSTGSSYYPAPMEQIEAVDVSQPAPDTREDTNGYEQHSDLHSTNQHGIHCKSMKEVSA